MSIYKNGKLVAGGSQALPLLCFMWSDHQLNHPSWLNSTTFSWQSGSVYQAAYQHLASDIDGKTLQSETISGTTIQFYLANDGHKICPASEESNVAAIYSATGVAWYYILDAVNQRFKLPRTKNPETNFIPDFAKQQVVTMPFTAPSDGWFISHSSNVDAVVYVNGVSVAQGNWWSGAWSGNLNCQIIVKKGDVVTGAAGTMRFIPFVEPNYNDKDEYKYLYFYVGNFTQTALENTAGINTELFNDKADVSTVAHVVTEFQEPTAQNNYTWYRKYRDGWVEQGGLQTSASGSSGVTVTLPVAMADANYTITATVTGVQVYFVGCLNKTATSFLWRSFNSTGEGYDKAGSWQVSGIAA